jgi:hypothetical protein
MKADTMFYIALGTVVDLIEKSDAWKGFVETAEDTEMENRYRYRALKYKAHAIVGFDREMDRLVKEYGYDARK